MYFFRDSAGNEIDLIIEREGEPIAIEIKSSKRIDEGMLRGLKYWQKQQPKSFSILLHKGSRNEMVNEQMSILPYSEVAYL